MLLDEGRQFRVIFRSLPGQRVLRRQRHVGCAKQCIRAGGVDLEAAAIVQVKTQGDPLGTADPVALHGAHLLRPSLQLLQVVQQLLGIGGDPDKPLADLAPLYRVVAAPTAAVHHLLVGQHGLIGGAPVDLRHLFIGQPLFKQTGEKPLLPAVVVRVAGAQFAVPVVGKTQPLQLAFHFLDIALGPNRRRHPILDGGVFRGHAEGIPTHGLQHVAALHALVTGDCIGDGVIADMAHMQLAAGIGKHGQAVEFLPPRILAHGKAVIFLPKCLRGLFHFRWIVTLFHARVCLPELR